jgi:hypothetical protein
MQRSMFSVLAALAAGAAAAQGDGRPNPLDAQAKVPAVEYRSAFEGYRPFAEQEPRDWRNANEEVRTAGGHAGPKPGQGPGHKTSKPEPGHGGHK